MLPEKVRNRIGEIYVPWKKFAEAEQPELNIPDDNYVPSYGVGESVHEFLKYKLMSIGENLGYLPHPEFSIEYRDKISKRGRLDVVWLEGESIAYAFEIEVRNPKHKILKKFQAVKNSSDYRVLFIYQVPNDWLIRFGFDLIREFRKEGVIVIANWPIPKMAALANLEREKVELESGLIPPNPHKGYITAFSPPCVDNAMKGVEAGNRNYAIIVLLTSFLSYGRILPQKLPVDRIADFIEDISVVEDEIVPLVIEAAEKCKPPLFEDESQDLKEIYYHMGFGNTVNPRLEDSGKSSWYRPPNCRKIKVEAPALCNPDELCSDIKNPLGYYYRALSLNLEVNAERRLGDLYEGRKAKIQQIKSKIKELEKNLGDDDYLTCRPEEVGNFRSLELFIRELEDAGMVELTRSWMKLLNF